MSKPFPVRLERDDASSVMAASIGVPLVDGYLRYLAAIGRAPTTLSSYAYDLAVFCRWLGAKYPDQDVASALLELTGVEVFAFVEDQFGEQPDRRPLAARTVYRRIVALAKCFDWAEAIGAVERNPVPRERSHGSFANRRGARPAFLRVPTPLPRPAPQQEIEAFVGSLRTWRDRALVGLLLGGGLRLSEALGLQLGDLDWGGKQVFVRHGKRGRQRYAMVPDSVWAVLKAYVETELPEPAAGAAAAGSPLFVTLHGSRRGRALAPAGVQSLFRHHRKLARTPNVTPHRLRHACATDLHRAGMPLEVLQEQLGHRLLESTRLYVHISNERLRTAYLAAQEQLYRLAGATEAING
ncbi:MAG: tyrosine-type recombinase/integrase [Dehalococcoidia bacterium]|nr:tyrosine-type recombinase/integrase [Dehalococcoidia bacterium]